MREYERKVEEELHDWRKKILKRPSLFNQISKKAQTRINEMIPEKAHNIITESMKSMVKTTLIGSNVITRKEQNSNNNLMERDDLLKEKLVSYRKTAVIEGAGTGAGGIFLGLADFPLLLSIKIKFLFEAATIYGFNTDEYEERLFILHVFQLAFSSDKKRKETLYIIDNWKTEKEKLLDMDWRVFQQEYRDYIDLIKLLQLIPGFGAIVGAYANHNLLDTLGETAMNVYRSRILTEHTL
ncbi:EcsC family protein [Virgibacillus sp. MSJ-26]|uniref:EcsC family protein n=1 Tax=Virgibacillus sp. MSJ-26 TaxID=2841522 RepID=UPI001C121D62|nr:EcsC family protein [Virgibacillus sp. MSJ-26]MBU5467444.1 EcsC family protein [Virgibacillus sp. MSJ-26]